MLNPEEEIILLSLQLQLDDPFMSLLNELITRVPDWKAFSSFMADRGVGQMFYYKLPELEDANQIPVEAQQKLKQSYFLTLSRNMRMQNAFQEIVKHCEGSGIKIVALKGISLSEWLYKDIGLRLLSDIDLLVAPEQGEMLLQKLQEIGYTSAPTDDFIGQHREIVHYEPLVKDGIAVEVHIKLHRSIQSYHLSEKDIISRAELHSSGKYYEPQKNDHLIFIAIHLDRHFRQGAIQLSGYSDLINMSRGLTTEDWDEIESKCKEWNCVDEFFLHFMLLDYYGQVDIPSMTVQNHHHLLNRNDKQLFQEYLQGKRFFQSGVPNHLSSIKLLSTGKKIKFILNTAFPSKSFMIEKYGIGRSEKYVAGSQKSKVSTEEGSNYKLQATNYKLLFWWLWYPYRWAVGVKGLLQTFKRNKTFKRRRP